MKTKDLENLWKQSKVNRFNFLEAKKKQWLNYSSQLKRNKLIVDLIQLEPSHLAENWILDQVIKWLKDRKNHAQFLEAAFTKKGKRDEIRNSDDIAKTFFLFNRIERIRKNNHISRKKAIELYLLTEDDEHILSDDIKRILSESASGFNVAYPEKIQSAYKKVEKKVTAIEQRFKRYRTILDKRKLPYPYYGLDFIDGYDENGNPKVDFHIFNKPVILGDSALFGTTKISYPLVKKSNQ
jgi:hypothetical protein